MKRKTLSLALAALCTVLLAACEIGPVPNYPQRTLLEMQNIWTASYEGTIEPGETQLFAIEIPRPFDDYTLFVLELDKNLTLESTNRMGDLVLEVSNGPTAFGVAPADEEPDSAGLVAGSLGSTGLGVQPETCRGSCLVRIARAQPLFFQVSGAAESTDFRIYAYPSDYADLGEDHNNNRATPSFYYLRTEDSGAIETVGDVDWWHVTTTYPEEPQTASFFFRAPNPLLDLRIYVYENGQRLDVDYSDGDLIEVERNQQFVVHSATGSAARGQPGFYYFEPNLLLVPVGEQAD